MRDYKKFTVWLRSHELTLIIYKDIAPYFPNSEKFGLTNQIKRAAYSIPINLAEGCGRGSEKEFVHFLDISLGSTQELEYCVFLIKELSFINEEQYLILNEKVNGIKAMIINLIKKIRSDIDRKH
jgi:four helix bundle protein